MALFGRAFHSTVARRVVLLFVGCTMVPLSGLALLTLSRTTRELDANARQHLHHDVKTLAMNGVERLSLLENRLRLFGLARLARGDDASRHLAPHVFGDRTPARTLAFAADGEAWQVVRGSAAPPVDLTGEQTTHLNRAGSLIARLPSATSEGAPEYWLLVRVRTDDRAGIAMAAIDQHVLWGIDDHLLPPASMLCVYDETAPLVCSAGVTPDLTRAAATVTSNAERALAIGGADAVLVRTWSVPLTHAYFSGPWVLALMRSQDTVYAPLARFTRDFWLVLLLSLLVAMLLSVGQVRRSLRPLAELTAATQRIARRQFDTRMDVRSGDEFEVLGDAINVLAADLKRQFDELEDFNLGTLAALARAIDAKSPWTRGHSERVTALAVLIGREMGLSVGQLTDLHRGGLVHDIGKLATPSAILDKKGPLTDEERRLVEQHPLRGAQILEPIRAYARLLPIVAEHHERWNGAGYPRGLKGLEIALTARILAVADTFDALRSDRPYRTGLPLSDAIAALVAGSGELFDPDVIDAFRRVMAQTNAPSSPQAAAETVLGLEHPHRRNEPALTRAAIGVESRGDCARVTPVKLPRIPVR